IESLFGSGTKLISEAKVSSSGVLKLKFSDKTGFVGAFGYGKSKEQYFGKGEDISSFRLDGDDPARQDYSIQVIYKDGSTQQLSSCVLALEPLANFLDQIAAGIYTIDRATGVVSVFGVSFKPDYFIEPLDFNDIMWLASNKDSNGIAWETGDYNGDGVIDLKLWSGFGKQVLYMLENR
ncbi:MAG: hypothetical protein HQK65_22390, partial [Desulfamplus sp.]|nr:hypothetical protein [Desulfamplus sp.]